MFTKLTLVSFVIKRLSFYLVKGRCNTATGEGNQNYVKMLSKATVELENKQV